jgi:hypothetical protein
MQHQHMVRALLAACIRGAARVTEPAQPPLVAGKTVALLDICLPLVNMMHIQAGRYRPPPLPSHARARAPRSGAVTLPGAQEHCKNFIVIDHHTRSARAA